MEERNAQQEYNLYLIVSLRLQLPRLGFMGTLVWFPKWCDCIINVSLSGNVVVLHGTMSTFFHSSHVRSRSCPAEFLWISVEWLTKRFGLNYLSFNSVLRISKEPWTKHFGGGKKNVQKLYLLAGIQWSVAAWAILRVCPRKTATRAQCLHVWRLEEIESPVTSCRMQEGFNAQCPGTDHITAPAGAPRLPLQLPPLIRLWLMGNTWRPVMAAGSRASRASATCMRSAAAVLARSLVHTLARPPACWVVPSSSRSHSWVVVQQLSPGVMRNGWLAMLFPKWDSGM